MENTTKYEKEFNRFVEIYAPENPHKREKFIRDLKGLIINFVYPKKAVKNG